MGGKDPKVTEGYWMEVKIIPPCLLVLLLGPENRGNAFLRNVGELLN
jgi:hypothetical protein